MFLAVLMLIAWQSTNNGVYQEPFKKSVEAEFANSELKRNFDVLVDKAKNKAPGIAKVAPLFYVVAVQKKFQFTSSKVTPFKNTVATYRYENRGGVISITWSF